MRLAKPIQDRFLRIISHSGSANFVDRHSRHFDSGSETDIVCPRRLEHFCGGDSSVAHQGSLILTVGHAYAQRGNSPCVRKLGVDLAVIIEVCQRLPKRA